MSAANDLERAEAWRATRPDCGICHKRGFVVLSVEPLNCGPCPRGCPAIKASGEVVSNPYAPILAAAVGDTP